ncbi:MAG: DUF4129 domain-containing protein [Cytophagaceae bacterium]
MRNLIRLFFLLFLTSFPAFAQDTATAVIPYDSSEIVARSFDQSRINSFRENSDFIYEHTNNEADIDLFSRFINWLIGNLVRMGVSADYEFLADLILYTLYAIAIAGVLYVVWILIGADKRFFLYFGSRKNKMHFEEVPSDIHEINFDKLIQEAIASKKYRLAIRLSYLLLLKELAVKNLISWSPEKTNYDYLRELQAGKLRDEFAHNTLMYEYVWYGDFEIDQDNFTNVSAAFRDFTKQVQAMA